MALSDTAESLLWSGHGNGEFFFSLRGVFGKFVKEVRLGGGVEGFCREEW